MVVKINSQAEDDIKVSARIHVFDGRWHDVTNIFTYSIDLL